jgi:GT2 family glycosyltransferase
MFPAVRLIELTENHGYAQGYNEALALVDSEYYILLNSDVEVCDNWIEPIITLMDSDDSIAACQPKLLDFNKKDTFEYAGAAGGFIDFLGYPFVEEESLII